MNATDKGKKKVAAEKEKDKRKTQGNESEMKQLESQLAEEKEARLRSKRDLEQLQIEERAKWQG